MPFAGSRHSRLRGVDPEFGYAIWRAIGPWEAGEPGERIRDWRVEMGADGASWSIGSELLRS